VKRPKQNRIVSDSGIAHADFSEIYTFILSRISRFNWVQFHG